MAKKSKHDHLFNEKFEFELPDEKPKPFPTITNSRLANAIASICSRIRLENGESPICTALSPEIIMVEIDDEKFRIEIKQISSIN